SATTYTANFKTQYQLTTNANPANGGTVNPSSGNWYDAGQQVVISASPANGYSFSNWSGSGTGSYSGTNNSQTITINNPITQTANFTQNPTNISVTVGTNLLGRSFTVDGTSYTTTRTFSWTPGSSHTISTTSPQSGGTGVRYVWSNWSDGGAISHTVSPTSNITYTANFITQYQLTTNANPTNGGTVNPASGNWYNAAQQVQISATPNSGFSFNGWTGAGSGSYSGTNNSQIITMNSPISQTANFSSTPTCSYSINPPSRSFRPSGGTGNFTITAPNGCAWTLSSNSSLNWLTVTSTLNSSGSGTVSYSVPQFTGSPRTGTITLLANNQTQAVHTVNQSSSTFDFDGDGKTDLAIFRPSLGEWWYVRSSDGINRAFQFGNDADKIVPADYTGDGKTDVAFFRPSTNEWFILRSENFTFYSAPFGAAGDVPVPADFDGDGKADLAVFRPSNRNWFIFRSSGGTTILEFGAAGDVPVIADYDGDGKADIAIYRPSKGEWWLLRSSDGGNRAFQFGSSTDKAIPADYTGDGKTDVAFFRPSTREWFILRSEDSSFYSFPFGATGDIPTPGDFDGDGKADPTVWRQSDRNWHILRSQSGYIAQQFGSSGDKPVPSAYIP
ncbi:MAG TPA: FG-GAP-like repeat-containing protein, partial [Pyrinomonadaceae bacterium]|nr:FG-GAP-like repeat-containing protein [Pyrinomonadaceae bacterium]